MAVAKKWPARSFPASAPRRPGGAVVAEACRRALASTPNALAVPPDAVLPWPMPAQVRSPSPWPNAEALVLFAVAPWPNADAFEDDAVPVPIPIAVDAGRDALLIWPTATDVAPRHQQYFTKTQRCGSRQPNSLTP